jgi:hypothetical protein
MLWRVATQTDSIWHVARQFKGKEKPASGRAAIASTFEDRFGPDPQQTTGDEWDS